MFQANLGHTVQEFKIKLKLIFFHFTNPMFFHKQEQFINDQTAKEMAEANELIEQLKSRQGNQKFF